MKENKYATALDGLVIEDPVKSFFDFCKERENIRIARENGEDFPWSADEIFQNGGSWMSLERTIELVNQLLNLQVI